MKELSLFIILFISGIILKAQAPEKINYQAVARDISGNPLINQSLVVIFQIRQGSPTGASVYTETHASVSTNQFGLFTAEIGGGIPSAGTFAGINWGGGLHYLSVIVDGLPIGTSQLLSVPYALYSKQSANGPQGAPGKNSISIVTPEPTGANCQNGGNKIDIGTDDNGDNILQPLEIDFTYYVCHGDSGAAGIGVNWLGNGATFPPTPNNENDAFYHSTHNTSYIYNGTTWDTLVSGNVGSAGFWTQSGNTIYNNNSSNLGNVSIGSTISLSKLTVASPDSSIASFIGSDPNIAVVSVINANATGTSGVAFVNGSNSNAFVGYTPSSKTLSIINNATDGHVFIYSDSAIVNQTLVIANQAQRIANQAQNAIYNNTDTIYNYSSTGPIIHGNSGLFLTDSLYVLGNNFLNPNWILANNGSGQARWTDPNTLGLGGSLWQSNTPNIYFNTGNVGIGTATPLSKLEVRNNASTVTDALFLSNTNNGDGYGTKIAFRSQFISTPWTQAEIHGITSNSVTQGSMVFNVMNNRSNNTLIEAMRINGDGNVGIGTTTPSAKLDVNGTINISNNTGEVNNTAKTGTANLVPIAYGNVTATGTINTGTGNFTINNTGTGTYLITVAGEVLDVSNCIIHINTQNSNPRFVGYGSTGGSLYVYIRDNTSAFINNNFSFIIYRP